MKSIALCINVPELAAGGFRDPALCAKYRGSGWAPYFHELAWKAGYRVLGCDEFGGPESEEAEANNRDGFVDYSEMTVICEEDNNRGDFLLHCNAKPGLVFSFESPLYAPEFYDALPKLKERFPRQMLFSGGTDPVYFPSFDWSEVKPIRSWSERKGVCLVAANKHYSMLPDKSDSPSFQQAKKDQLHDMRYRAIERLKPDVYGLGWSTQLAWNTRPEALGPVADKIETLSQYKYALCFENVSQPGYITEKIIDCFVAGTVPIYMGAPDIWKRVPDGAFLDWAHDSKRLQGDFLNDQADWQIRVTKGRDFLYERGWKYSYPGFAQWVLDILEGKA